MIPNTVSLTLKKLRLLLRHTTSKYTCCTANNLDHMFSEFNVDVVGEADFKCFVVILLQIPFQ